MLGWKYFNEYSQFQPQYSYKVYSCIKIFTTSNKIFLRFTAIYNYSLGFFGQPVIIPTLQNAPSMQLQRANYKMEKRHKQLLRKNRVTLVEDLEPKDLLGYLFQDGAINQNDMERVKSEKTRTSQAEMLLDILPRRGPKAFAVFLDSLWKVDGQKHLALVLQANITEPSSGVTEHSDSPSYARNPIRQPQATQPQYGDKEPLSGLAVKIDDSDVYVMKCQPHGLCLIVNNKNFVAGLNDRSGSGIDAKNLQMLFVSLHYRVQLHTNLSSQQLKETLFKFARHEDHQEYDSVVICILSHGLEGKIYGTDGVLIPVAELIGMFNGYQAKNLIGKPKLFFIQACRGGDYDHGAINMNTTDGCVDEITTEQVLDEIYHNSYDESDSFVDQTSVPSEADFLIAYSTVPGYVSWRHSQKGSWFIQALVDVFKAQAKHEDLVSMLVKVNGKVARDFESNNKKKQIPAPVIMLTKKLYFFPQH